MAQRPRAGCIHQIVKGRALHLDPGVKGQKLSGFNHLQDRSFDRAALFHNIGPVPFNRLSIARRIAKPIAAVTAAARAQPLLDQALGKQDRNLLGIIALGHMVDQRGHQIRGHRMGMGPQHDMQRTGRPNQTRQTLRGPAPGRQANRQIRQTKTCIGHGHPVMRSQGQFEPGTGGMAFDQGDNRYLHIFDTGAETGQIGLFNPAVQFTVIDARGKGAVIADNHHGAHGGIGGGFGQTFYQPGPDHRNQSIDRRICNAQHRHTIHYTVTYLPRQNTVPTGPFGGPLPKVKIGFSQSVTQGEA